MSEAAERLFERALGLDPEARTAFVEEACRGDPRLRQELLSLLVEADAAEEFFDRLADAVFSPDPELQAGDAVGRYRIVSLIASSGMSTVYRAHDTRLDRHVALKFLPAYSSAEAEARDRLLTEARAAAALEHPNVCSIHEIGETDDGRLFIAMACYEGETLKERLRRGPLSVEEAVATAVQIARALAAAHAHGIIHRDVKPGNVMLGADGTVRLLDFGLATVSDATLTASGITPGTVAYMSPEQTRGDALDPRTDLWSLGVVVYEMLAGERPFQGNDLRTLRHAILDQDPEPIAKRRAEVPGALARIVERLLRKDSGARYGSASEVLADLTGALPPVTGTSRAGAFSRRRAALLAGSAFLLLAVAGTVVVPRWRGDRSVSATAAGRRAPSIAVLPLANLGADSGNAALAAGITEELIAMLSGTGDVRVIASTSTARFKGREMDARTIAESLGVSNVLQGGVHRIGSRLRVQVRLVDGRDGSTRWSQAYDREFKDVLSVQDEIARAVAGELGMRFDKDRQLLRHKTRNVAAYELYLRATDPLLLRTQGGIWKSQEYFQEAIAADSTYAAAHAGLALVYVRRARTASDPGMPIPKLLALAEAAANRAVALDDSLAETHYALGRVLEAQLDFRRAETEIRRAIAIDPTRSIYRRSLSYLHGWAGRPEDELAEARRSLETDPLNPYAQAAVAGGLFAVRRYDEALALKQRLATIQPPLQGVQFGIAQIYAVKRMWPAAIAALRPHAESGDPMFVALLGHMLARAGQRDEAKRILADRLAHQERTGGGAFQIAMVYVGLGDRDQAFAWLDRSVDDRTISAMMMGPMFEELHGDPRFARLRERLGLRKG